MPKLIPVKPKTETKIQSSPLPADGIAYRRVFTEISLSKEIWEAVVEIQGNPSEPELEKMKNRQMLPFFEGRYLLVDRELKKSNIKQVLELAPGLSGRGIQMTSDASVVYVELDLAEKSLLKRRVFKQLTAKYRPTISQRDNLIFESGNSLFYLLN